MKRLLPRFDLCRWAGSDIDSMGWCEGRSLAIQWLGLIFEINLARVTGQKGKAR